MLDITRESQFLWIFRWTDSIPGQQVGGWRVVLGNLTGLQFISRTLPTEPRPRLPVARTADLQVSIRLVLLIPSVMMAGVLLTSKRIQGGWRRQSKAQINCQTNNYTLSSRISYSSGIVSAGFFDIEGLLEVRPVLCSRTKTFDVSACRICFSRKRNQWVNLTCLNNCIG